MKDNKSIRRLICLTPETDEMLRVVTKYSFTNKSQKLRSLIADEYKNIQNQINSVSQIRL